MSGFRSIDSMTTHQLPHPRQTRARSGEPAPRSTRSRILHPSEYRELAQFRYALRHFLSFSEAAAAELGLAPQQYQALLAITGFGPGDGPGMTINMLAKSLLIKHNSAVGLVDRLEDEGLVTRRAAKDDRRKVNLSLTRKGLRVFERLAAAHRAELQRIGPQLAEFLHYFARRPGKSARASSPPRARSVARRGNTLAG